MDINKIVEYSKLINFTPIPWCIKPKYCGMGSILLFHNISPLKSDNLLKNGNYYRTITPERLEEIILFFKKRNYRIISMDELYGILETGDKSERFVVFTLDDGMLDNLKYAYPVFKKYNVPFIIYLPTKFIGSSETLSIEYLENCLLAKDKVKLSGVFGDRTVDISKTYQKDSLLKDMIQTIEFNYQNYDLFSLFDDNNWDGYKYSERSYLNWDEVRELSKDPLCSIGSHTVNHIMLSKISDESLVKELGESKETIENKIQKPVEHFSYPHGTKIAAGMREFKFTRETGYQTGTTVRYANIHKEHSNFLHCLPRYTIKPYFTDAHLSMISNGTLQFLLNKAKRIITED